MTLELTRTFPMEPNATPTVQQIIIANNIIVFLKYFTLIFKTTIYYYFNQFQHFKASKISIWALTEDIPIPGNALPIRTHFLDKELSNYLSIDRNRKPLLQHWNYRPIHHQDDGEWPDHDYLELPEDVKKATHRY